MPWPSPADWCSLPSGLADVAQSVERWLPKPKVAGSRPVVRSSVTEPKPAWLRRIRGFGAPRRQSVKVRQRPSVEGMGGARVAHAQPRGRRAMIRRPVTSQGHRYAQFQRALRQVRSWAQWAALASTLSFAGVLVLYAATRVTMPPIGCTFPQPVGKQAAFDSATTAIENVTRVANWLVIASLVVLALGVVAARVRLRLFLLFIPLAVIALVVIGEGHDLTLGPCTE